jgi:hypothetical protein
MELQSLCYVFRCLGKKAACGSARQEHVGSSSFVCNQLLAYILIDGSHGKTDPAEGIDFFYDQRRARTPRKAVFFGIPTATNAQAKRLVDTTACYQCKHCPSRSTRRFQLQGVTSHIKAKYVFLYCCFLMSDLTLPPGMVLMFP